MLELKGAFNEKKEDSGEQYTHPSIVNIFHYFEDTKRYLLVTELCQHGELYKYFVDQNYKIEVNQAALILKQVLSAISFMHKKNICHRDLKPENILIDQIGQDKTDYIKFKLIDFGTA